MVGGTGLGCGTGLGSDTGAIGGGAATGIVGGFTTSLDICCDTFYLLSSGRGFTAKACTRKFIKLELPTATSLVFKTHNGPLHTIYHSSRFDFDRYGLVTRSSPRQADLILTAGTVTMKMAPSLVRLYEQMPEPKYVIAMGACTITGGMFSTDSYRTIRGVDKLIPVDEYLPGCPSKPKAVIDAITKLRKKISRHFIFFANR
ncbi:PREDICTED: uncharacterized protein LOC109220713 [Nicotiana attenuata]|uniref:uncharacterized protein LOC109220713 n=1 Tax=Nicotiana attenuata TaxID=49451 RepID=UPI0009055B8D|nr:PREDICTED: uncharacterized protein LOC109220713 [Nicotiana attenuata]